MIRKFSSNPMHCVLVKVIQNVCVFAFYFLLRDTSFRMNSRCHRRLTKLRIFKNEKTKEEEEDDDDEREKE